MVTSQIVTISYKCTDAEVLACDAELKLCLGNRLVRESQMLQCESCYRAAYGCYADCEKRFSTTFGKSCYDSCTPKYMDACAPQEFQFAPDSGSIRLTLSLPLSVILPFVSTLLITLYSLIG